MADLIVDGELYFENIELAAWPHTRALGLMFRRPRPIGLVYGSVAERGVHGMFCRGALDVAWSVNGTVMATETLEPWTTSGSHPCGLVLEAPEGELEALGEGSEVSVDYS